MVANKHISKIVLAVMAAAVVLCLLACAFSGRLTELLGGSGVNMEYESKLFDTDEIIEINIQMDEDEWERMLSNATAEEYYVCNVTINGKTLKNVAIRPKGNTSLSAIAMDPDSDRFSLKLEFGHFVAGQTCWGLDKLILNNNYADATNMKEAIVYDMYEYLGADASLYNYAKVSVNGEYWGVYLALEAVEESFMLRNYGTQDGELYKPDSLEMRGGGDAAGITMPGMGGFGGFSFGGGDESSSFGGFSFGGGKGGKDEASSEGGNEASSEGNGEASSEGGTETAAPTGLSAGTLSARVTTLASTGGSEASSAGGGEASSAGGDEASSAGGDEASSAGGDEASSAGGGDTAQTEGGESGFDAGSMPDMSGFDAGSMPDMSGFEGGERPDMGDFDPGSMGGGFSMGGGSGANLNYSDDELDSYSLIWDGAVTGTGTADHRRVVTALKNISEGTDLEKYLDIDNVLKYMAVHTFAVNMDSLSGSMAHNYYLYEYDGQLNIIPWDYNLSFGGMSNVGNGNGSATDMVNDAIDTPFSGTQFFDALLENEEYLARYHAYLQQLVDEYVNGGRFDEVYTRIRSQIDELVATDPTAFYSYEEYDNAAEILYETVKLRAESIEGQLDGSIPSTDAGQRADSSALIDASHIDLSAMGQFDMGGGSDRGDGEESGEGAEGGFGGGFSFGGEMPDMSGFSGGERPDMGDFSGGERPDMGDFSGGEMPDMSGFDFSGAESEDGGSGERPAFSGMPGGSADQTKTNNLILFGGCLALALAALGASFALKRRRS